MEANPRKLYEFLHAGNQFVIPVFQRKYVWKKKNWERLWDDLQALSEAPQKVHFMGSFVSVPYKTEPGVPPQFLVIDGQQRMITLVTLLAAIRDEAKAAGDENLSKQIQTDYLIHQYLQGDLRYKVFPRLRDRGAFFALVDEMPDGNDGSGITEAYRFFRERMAECRPEDRPIYLRALFAAATQQLAFVSITLDSEQNPWAIFETLNASGVPLKQSDLIRNHVFMHVPLREQDEFDERHWKAFEDQFEATDTVRAIEVADFCRHFLMRTGEYVRPEATYLAFQEDEAVKSLSPEELTRLLAEYARYYCWLERPHTAPDKVLQIELDLLKRLDITTTYPLMLHLLKLYADGVLTPEAVARCTRALESWYIRRAIIGWSTGGYNRTLPAAIPELEEGDVLGSLARYLAKRGWPDDEDFIKALPEYPIYRYWIKVTRVMLLALEAPDSHKETVEVGALLDKGTISIEHVLPQTVKDDDYGREWMTMLGDDWQADHVKWLHTLGNLTLTGYNTKLSNHGYDWKCEEFKKSHIELNRWFLERPVWDAGAIRKRGEVLTTQIAELWEPAGGFDATAGATTAEDLDDAPPLEGAALQTLYRDFWDGYEGHLRAAGSYELEHMTASSWYKRVKSELAWVAIYVIARANSRELVVQAYGGSASSPSVFGLLRRHHKVIEDSLGPALTWTAVEDGRRRSIDVTRRFEIDDTASWEDGYKWLDQTIENTHRALTPLLGRNLPGGESRVWNEADYFAQLSASCPAAAAGARRVVEWASDAGCDVRWGRRGKYAYVNVFVPCEPGPKLMLRLYGDNAIAVTMNYLKSTSAFASDEARTELRDRLNRAELLALDVIDGEPWFPITMLCESDTRAGFLDALAWVVEKAGGTVRESDA